MVLPGGRLFFLKFVPSGKGSLRSDVGLYYCNATNPDTKVSAISRPARLDVAGQLFESSCCYLSLLLFILVVVYPCCCCCCKSLLLLRVVDDDDPFLNFSLRFANRNHNVDATVTNHGELMMMMMMVMMQVVVIIIMMLW